MPPKLANKRARPDTVGPGNGWQIVYTSFVLILLSFFIMLSSFATMDEAKVLQFTRSFADAVNVLSGGLGFERGRTILNPALEITDKESALADIFNAVAAYSEALELENEVDLASTAKGIVLILSDKALFSLGDAQVTAEAETLLKKIGAIISQTNYSVRIEGHTDNLPIRTDRFPSNWELSTARAVNVLRFFVERLNIPARRIFAVGFGEFQPRYPNASEAERSLNRRVEIIFMQSANEDVIEDALR